MKILLRLLAFTLMSAFLLSGCGGGGGGGSSSPSVLGSGDGVTVTSLTPDTVAFGTNGLPTNNSFTVTGSGFTSGGRTIDTVQLVNPNSPVGGPGFLYDCTVQSVTNTQIVFSIPATFGDGPITVSAEQYVNVGCSVQLVIDNNNV